jgi:hypothetical protein
MLIQVNTDHNTDGREKVAEYVRGAIEGAVGRFADQLTRVEVHLGDENGAKGGQDDKRCMMEARIEGRAPIAVTHFGSTLDDAIAGAVGKLQRSLENVLQKQQEHR